MSPPTLLALLNPRTTTGSLLVYQRPASYQERRTDGYQEPEMIYVLGTAHMSRQSATDVVKLIEVGADLTSQPASPHHNGSCAAAGSECLLHQRLKQPSCSSSAHA